MSKHPEVKIVCDRMNCYGIVKEYEEGGVREPPEYLYEEDGLIKKIIKRMKKKLGMEVEKFTWKECSVCGTVWDDKL